MALLDLATALVAHFEGFSSYPYRDVTGTWTIGYGQTHLPDGSPVTARTPPVSPAKALQNLSVSLEDTIHFVERSVKVPLTDHEAAALVSFTYNVGQTAFTDSTLRRLLNAGDKAGAADQFLLWDWSKGRRIAGLTSRRQQERAEFLN